MHYYLAIYRAKKAFSDPAAFVISILHSIITTIAAILLSTSPTIGFNPGF